MAMRFGLEMEMGVDLDWVCLTSATSLDRCYLS